jgi:hypothetical protein
LAIRLDRCLAIAQDTAQLAPPQIPHTQNFAKRITYMPNNVDGAMPNNSERDSEAEADPAGEQSAEE